MIMCVTTLEIVQVNDEARFVPATLGIVCTSQWGGLIRVQ